MLSERGITGERRGVVRLGWLIGSVFLLLSSWANAGRLDDVRAVKLLRVCAAVDLPSISYRGTEAGRLTGVSADLARELARDLGVQVKFVEVPFAKMPDQVLQNRCDLAIGVLGLTARGDRLRFTRPHLGGGLCAVVARENVRIKEWGDLDKKGVQIAVTKGSIAEIAARESLKNASLQVLENAADRAHEVEAHRTDALLTDCQESAQIQEGTSWGRQMTAPTGSLFRNVSYAWAMVPDDDRWYARVEYFLSEIRRDGRLRTAARRYGVERLALMN